MINRSTKLKWRRLFRKRKKQVEQLGAQTEENIERHFFKRFARLLHVRRFVIGWVLLCVFMIGGVIAQTSVLGNYYRVKTPVAGGTFTDGIYGSFTNANPIYATGPVDSAVAKLVFSGLLSYDSTGELVNDLAQDWKVDATEKVYTVTLKDDLKWQDGKDLTSNDVAFTYRTIQNPDARSPLFSSWQGVDIETPDDKTIVFTLPNVLSSFQYGLTTGIVPEHLLGDIPAAQLRATRFNTVTPVGAGPFKLNAIELSNEENAQQGRIGFVPNELHHSGVPQLQRFVIRYFTDPKQMTESFKNNELTAMSGLDSFPEELAGDASVKEFNIPLTAQVMVFFKNSQPVLADAKVRQALVQSVDKATLLRNIGYPVISSDQPFLQQHAGYDPSLDQLPFDKAAAEKALDEAGWVKGESGVRSKDGAELQFTLYSQSTTEYAYVTQQLQNSWREIGVNVDVLLQPDSDLQVTVAGHNYDALLYGISLGLDPDVYAYWGSTQADERATNRVNFSEYKSSKADAALEAGRTRTDDGLRAVKYKPFLEAWRSDAPALALYQPRYLYITNQTVFGFDPQTYNSATDRYNNVVNWKIRQETIDKLQAN